MSLPRTTSPRPGWPRLACRGHRPEKGDARIETSRLYQAVLPTVLDMSIRPNEIASEIKRRGPCLTLSFHTPTVALSSIIQYRHGDIACASRRIVSFRFSIRTAPRRATRSRPGRMLNGFYVWRPTRSDVVRILRSRFLYPIFRRSAALICWRCLQGARCGN